MANVFRTIAVPGSSGAVAAKIAEALGYPEQGMFTEQIAERQPAEEEEERVIVGYISTGVLDDASPVLLDDPAALLAAIPTPHDVTLADCQAYIEARDLTDDDPHARQDLLRAEASEPVAALPWSTGIIYAKDAVASHAGALWRSLIASNVWAPGVAGWRRLWAEAADTPPEWIQPTGSADYYTLGELATHNGQVWSSDYAVNVWEPGVFGWSLVEEEEPEPGPVEWQAGVAYTIGDEVTYQGTTYRCRQSHTSLPGWTPSAVLSLWLPL